MSRSGRASQDIHRFAIDRWRKSKQLLERMRENGEIDENIFIELAGYVDELHIRLVRLASGFEQLSRTEHASLLEDLVKASRRPQTEEEIALTIRDIICKDSHNVRIRQKAADLARAFSESNGLPSLPRPGIHKLYDLPRTRYNPESIKLINQFIQHCNGIATYIAKWVARNITYLSEADDVFQTSIQTLDVVRAGDCDDYTILVCSLLRSIGYEVYAGLMPGHLFPGVILARCYHNESGALEGLKTAKTSKELKVRLIAVPLDRDIVEGELVRVPLVTQIGTLGNVDITVDDIISGSLNDKLMQINRIVRRLASQGKEDEAGKVVSFVEDFVKKPLVRLSELLEGYKLARKLPIYCDGQPTQIDAEDLFDVFQEDISLLSRS